LPETFPQATTNIVKNSERSRFSYFLSDFFTFIVLSWSWLAEKSLTALLYFVSLSTFTHSSNDVLCVVSNTKAAVEAGNFSKANTEFSQFEDNWKQVEDGIKAKSSDRYKAIEDSLDRVTGELKGSQPNKQQVLSDLQSMENNINSVAKL
jgi:septal ring factor EnvC (AmiA/AmiB activator)